MITACHAKSGEELPLKAGIKPASTWRLSHLLELRAELKELRGKLDDYFKRFAPLHILVSFPTDRYGQLADIYRVPTPPGQASAISKLLMVIPIYLPPQKHLASAIASVQNRSYENWDLVLVNDAPDDVDTLSYLHRLPGWHFRLVRYRHKNPVTDCGNDWWMTGQRSPQRAISLHFSRHSPWTK